MRTNILVQYRGGGYDGCYWEWNYFFIDAEEKFFNICATGRNGITRAEDAESVMDDAYTYDVSNDTEMQTFAKESNPIHVVMVVRWLIANGYGDHAAVYCSKCGKTVRDIGEMEEIRYEDPRFGHWHGDGGIGVTCDEIYCERCREEDE